jgi:hypothetical protein
MQTIHLTSVRPDCFRAALIFAVGILLFAATGNSQLAGTGNIQGTVVDPSGAILQNATVIATDTATGVQHTANSGADGLYSLPNLPIGNYAVEVTAPGFKHFSKEGVVLEVGSSIRVDVSMTVGQTDQNVEVQADGIALQTEDSSFKQTIDQTTLTELPLNGRQVTSLITLSGGSAPAPINDIQGSKSFYSSVVISVAGGMGNATDYRLDGGDNNDYMTNVNLPFPFPDAVSEFSVETAALGAQSGLHPGGLVNVVTRSGSNQWHGSGFEFIRNNFIDATNFFSVTKDTLHQNQYGGTIGGKIISNKLFFFTGYQRTSANQSQALTPAYVPTAANLAGDFSATDGAGCQSSGQAVQLLNPLTGAVLPNDMISPSYFSAQALAMQKYLPTPTNPCGLVFYTIPSETGENQFVTRVDDTLTQKNTLYGRYFLDGYTAPAFFSPNNVLITAQTGNNERVQALTLGETYIISSNTVNSFHATGTRRRIDRGANAEGINPNTIGVNTYAPVLNFLEMNVSNKWNSYCTKCAAADFNQNTFAFADDVNLVRGKHQISFGGEYVRSQFNTTNNGISNGDFTFTGIYSQEGPAGISAGGTGADANLDFLTGALNSFAQSKVDQSGLRAPIPSLYVQDTYRATKKLVLSGGVRWDPWYMPVEVRNRGLMFNYNDFLDNVVSQVYTNAPAGILFYGDKGVPRGFTSNSLWQFSPRVGITFDPTGAGKTVIRAGAAVVYDEPNFFTATAVNSDPPFATSITNVPVNQPLSLGNPWSSGTVMGNPFPMPVIPPSNQTFTNQSLYTTLPAHFHPPYTLQWTASAQRQLAHNWQVQLDYIGSKTSFNPYGYPLDPAVYIPGTCGGAPCSTTGNSASRFALTIANPAVGPAFQGGGAGSLLIASGANSSYNGMIATVQHRLSSNFSFLANYTWSHCIDIEDAQGDISSVTVQNPANINGDRGNCGADFRSLFNTYIVAKSKFNVTGWKAQAINNWQLAPVMQVRDGAPFTVYSGVDNSLTDIGNDRPNLINPSEIYTRAKIISGGNLNFLNASAFAQNATGRFGDVGNNSLRGPSYVDLDSELSRYFPINDRFKLDFRLEGFNVLNHPNFSTPATTQLVSSNFGQITSTASGARIFQGALKIIF